MFFLLIFLVLFLFCLRFFFKIFLAAFWIDFELPDWWYNKPVVDFFIRPMLLLIRWLYRRTLGPLLERCRAYLWRLGSFLYHLYKRLSIHKARRYLQDKVAGFKIIIYPWIFSPFYYRLSKYPAEEPGHVLYIFYVDLRLRRRPWRECLVLGFCLFLHFFKFIFFSLRALHKELHNNSFVYFLLYLREPLSFVEFNLLLGFLLCFFWWLLKFLSFFYNGLIVLLAFFGVFFSEEFMVVFFSFNILLLSFFFLDGAFRLGWAIFLHTFGLERGSLHPLVFFFFFCGLSFFFALAVNLGLILWQHQPFLFFPLFFFSADFYMFYAYRCLWFACNNRGLLSPKQ